MGASAGGDLVEIGDAVQERCELLNDWALNLMPKAKNEYPVSCWDPCIALDVASQDALGSAQILYRNTVTENLLLSPAPPLRLIFLDVDGVLNTKGSKNSGALSPDLLSGIRKAIVDTGAFVILSSTWRSWPQLRVLIMAALPKGSVVGQTPLEDPGDGSWVNCVRPREIRHCLSQIEADVGPVTSWAAVDDMNLIGQANDLAKHDKSMKRFKEVLDAHFVKTDEYVGLDEKNHFPYKALDVATWSIIGVKWWWMNALVFVQIDDFSAVSDQCAVAVYTHLQT